LINVLTRHQDTTFETKTKTKAVTIKTKTKTKKVKILSRDFPSLADGDEYYAQKYR